MNRLADLCGRTRTAWVFSVVLTSIVCGVGHFGQGRVGRIKNVIGGILVATFYLVFGRKLGVPIVAHGVQDTVDVVLIFLGEYPGGL